jgi:hypothetical protein
MAVADLTSIARRSSKQRSTFDSNTGPCPSVPSPASGGALHCSAAPVHSLFTFSLKPNAPVCDQVIFPMGSDAGIELDGKEVAGKWYSSLMQDQGAKVCSSSRILHSMTTKLPSNAADLTPTPQQTAARTSQELRKEHAACRSQVA